MFTGVSPLAASKLVNSTPRQLFPSLSPIVRTTGRTHDDAIDRFPISVAMEALTANEVAHPDSCRRGIQKDYGVTAEPHC